ncbi:MAG: AraC family transcriptional regulator [Bacteroidetes bacterium]|nr:MAG: AraC family transcriptional regulator [Bacteroidota bacterium]
MDYSFENIVHDSILPFKIFFHSIRSCSPHWHTDLELLFILKGSVLTHIEGKQILLETGDVVLINSSAIHLTHETEENNIILAFQLDPEFAIPLDPEFTDRVFFCSSTLDKEPEHYEFYNSLKINLASLMFIMKEEKKGYHFEAASTVNKILMMLVNNFQVSVPSIGLRQGLIEENSRYFSRIASIIRYIDRHYTEKITASDLAEKEGINSSYLSRFFHEKTGSTFSKYLAFVRLQKSLKALVSIDSNISNIALDFGFPSVKAYNTTFREILNTTPSTWREEKLTSTGKPPGETVAIGYNPYSDFNSGNAMKLLSAYLGKK